MLKKILIILLVTILSGYILTQTRIKGLWEVFWYDEALISNAIIGQDNFDFEYMTPSKQFLRWVVDHKKIDYGPGFYYGTRDSLEFIMTQYLGMADNHASQEDLDYALKIADRAIQGGALIDSYRQGVGFTVLHDAIFRKNPVAVRFLIDHGASCSMKILRPDTQLDHLNAYQLADHMNNKSPGSMKDIYPILNDCKDKNLQ